jgi:hypothetical protein
LDGGSATVDGDQAGVDVADLAVFGLDAGEIESVDQDGEAFAAGYGSDGVGCAARLPENLCGIRMIGAVDVAYFVSPNG